MVVVVASEACQVAALPLGLLALAAELAVLALFRVPFFRRMAAAAAEMMAAPKSEVVAAAAAAAVIEADSNFAVQDTAAAAAAAEHMADFLLQLEAAAQIMNAADQAAGQVA